MRRILSVFALIVLLTPAFAFASWTGVENFDSYTNGDNLNGKNGGTGWSGAWTDVALSLYVVSNAQSVSSPNSVSFTTSTGQEAAIKRSVTTASSVDGDVVEFQFRKTTTSVNLPNIQFYSGGTFITFVVFDTSGAITLNGTNVGSYSANTWYKIDVQFDYTNDRARVSVDGGAYSSYVAFSTAVSSLDTIWLSNSAAGSGSMTVYWDSIQAPAAATVASSPFFWAFWW